MTYLSDNPPPDLAGYILLGLFFLCMAIAVTAIVHLRPFTKGKDYPERKPGGCSEGSNGNARAHDILVCASGTSGVVRRRRRLNHATTKALLEETGRIADRDFANACLRQQVRS